MSAVLFENARFHTGREKDEVYKYMLVERGRIIELSDTPPEKRAYKKSVDLDGQQVYPCMIDAHVHLLYTIVTSAVGFDICSITGNKVVPNTIAGVEERLRAFAQGKSKNELVVANNYILSAIDELRLPTRQELDDWCGGRAAVIYTIDGHASALSTAMLEKLGIESEGHSGMLRGEAHEKIQGRLTDIIASAVTPAVLARGIAAVENNCAKWGISHVAALDGNGDSEKDPTTSLLVFLARRMRLKTRIYFQYLNAQRVERWRKYQLHPRLGGCGEWEMDGATGAHSSAFRVAFKDTGTTAECYYSQQQVDEAVKKADELGYQIASHAIGECAVERITKALLKTKPGRFHRVEHGEFFDEESFERYKSGRFAVVMQPGYAWIDKHFLHSYEQFLPEEIIKSLKFASLYRAGVCVCASSDSPVQSMDPFVQMRGMCQFYHEEESLTPFEAFRCYTINPARAIEEEANIGTLEVGKEANFFTADRELFDLSADEITDFKINSTYYGGKAYKKKKGSLPELIKLALTVPHKI